MASILHWRPICPLGSGSFGHVSLGLNLHDSSLLAAKAAPSSSSVALLSLQNEFHILRSLQSPFILRCLGGQFSSSAHVNSSPILQTIFMEYMDGGSLADLIKRSGGKLPDEGLIRHYTRAILQGLDYLHQNGIVHCDIKSHNILIGSSGVKIADFGTARRMGKPELEADRTVRGTPLWMPPEAMQGMQQGTASDIWSLGCTVVEMLQGRPPWAHLSSLAALLRKVESTHEDPPLPESISADARNFLLRCLHRDPEARPKAAELLQHPFLRRNSQPADLIKAAAMYVDQPSPRSSMSFVQSEGESYWEDESRIASVPTLAGGDPPLTRPATTLDGSSTAPRDKICGGADQLMYQAPANLSGASPASGKWMTVRRRERIGSEEMPDPSFKLQAAGAGRLLQAKKRCEVSLESAAFLTAKRPRLESKSGVSLAEIHSWSRNPRF